MKKKEYDVLIDNILSSVIDWCANNNAKFFRTGKYSGFIPETSFNYEKIEDIKESIKNALNITKKKLNKVIEIVFVKNRIYVLFKAQVSMY